MANIFSINTYILKSAHKAHQLRTAAPEDDTEEEELSSGLNAQWSNRAACVRWRTDLVSLEEAEDVLDPGVVGEALHPDQAAGLGHYGGGRSRRRSCGGRRRCCGVRLGRHRRRHGSGRSCKVAHCGWRDWGAAERERESGCVIHVQAVKKKTKEKKGGESAAHACSRFKIRELYL